MSENPLEIVVKDTGRIVGWACPTCRILCPVSIYACPSERAEEAAKAAAERCCVPNVCECGATCERHWTVCKACRWKKETAKDAKEYADAPKLTLEEYLDVHPNGMLMLDYETFVMADGADGHNMGEHVWCCEPDTLSLGAHGVLESALEEFHDGAIDECDVEGLQRLLDEWTAANPVTCWRQGKHALHPDDVAKLRAESVEDGARESDA